MVRNSKERKDYINQDGWETSLMQQSIPVSLQPDTSTYHSGLSPLQSFILLFFAVQLLSRSWLFCDPVDGSLPGSPVYGVHQARILECICHCLLQGIFPAQGSNPHFLHWEADSLSLNHQESLHIPKCVQTINDLTDNSLETGPGSVKYTQKLHNCIHYISTTESHQCTEKGWMNALICHNSKICGCYKNWIC